MEMIRVLTVASAVVAICFLTGCATIMSGGSQEVSFVSNPEGATVTVGGRVLGKAPLTTRIDRKTGQTLSFEKEGYKALTMNLETTVNPWLFGNVICCGLLGSTTDLASGGFYKYAPSQYMVTLQPAETTPLEGPAAKSDAQKAKEFIVIGYGNLLNDLSVGEGSHLSSLLTMLEIPEEDRGEATQKIRTLSEEYKEIPEFADQVVNLYVKQP
jgi:hypothetical protein